MFKNGDKVKYRSSFDHNDLVMTYFRQHIYNKYSGGTVAQGNYSLSYYPLGSVLVLLDSEIELVKRKEFYTYREIKESLNEQPKS